MRWERSLMASTLEATLKNVEALDADAEKSINIDEQPAQAAHAALYSACIH
jgi:hypothetical protein